MKVNTSVALKAGLIGAVAGIVLGAIFGLIPLFGGCLSQWGGAIVGLATGALYVYLTPTKEDLVGGAVGGAITGAIAGLASAFASNLLELLLRQGSVLSLFTGLIYGAIGGAVLGAIGGLIYAAIKKR